MNRSVVFSFLRGDPVRVQGALLATIIVCGVILSFVLFSIVRYWESNVIQAEFDKLARSQEITLKNVITQNLDVLEYVYSLYLSSNSVTAGEFHTFLDAPLSRHDAIIAIGWAEAVGGDEVAFRYVEPSGQGRDQVVPRLREHADFRRSLIRARDTGMEVTTGRISFSVENESKYGIVFIKPVYRKGALTRTVMERREHIQGYLYEVVDIVGLIGEAAVSWGIFNMNISLVDEMAPAEARLLFYYDSDIKFLSVFSLPGAFSQSSRQALVRASTLELPGRKWSLIVKPGHEFYATQAGWQSWAVLLSSLLSTALLSVFQAGTIRRTREITKLAKGLSEANQELESQMSRRREIEQALQKVAGAVSSSTGDEFFRGLVNNLTNTLGVDIALIAKLSDVDKDCLETIAVCAGGEIVENFRYRMEGTPCSNVFNKEVCFYPRHIREMFPRDHLLREMEIESYIGVPLFDMESNPLGVVVVLGHGAMESRQPAESIMRIFAARIVAEMQHMRAREEIQDLIKFPNENPSPVLRVDREGNILYANGGSRKLLENWGCDIGSRVPDGILRHCREALASGTGSEFDVSCGERKYSFILAPSQEHGYVSIYGHDITEREMARLQMSKLSEALEQTADSVMITDINGVIEYVNQAFERTTGYSAAEAIGSRPSIVKSGRHDNAFYKKLWETILSGKVYRDVIINRRKDGTLYYEEKSITPLKDQKGKVINFISAGMDITKRMQAEERLHHLAYHDVLTDLPNRTLFMERLSHALLQRHEDGAKVAVLFLDVDRFKAINDTLGHESGDRFLQSFSRLLLGCVRSGDTVSRFGGDEFAILLENVTSVEAVSAVAEKILDTLSRPFRVEGPDLYVTTSIGIAIYPDDADNANILLKQADSAMYQAKETGRNTFKFYSDEMSVKASRRLLVESHLRGALEKGEFHLNYQPQVEVLSGRIIGAEALLRWNNPKLGMVSPMEFIPIMEDIGMIKEVGEWVLHTACKQVKEWNAGLPHPLRIAVNISGRQFSDTGLRNQIARVLDEVGLDHQLLELEITESVLMQDDKATMENLRELHGMGMKLSIDDFGTGYSSLSYLKRFPVDCLKIDRSFVRDITSDPDDATIVSAIIAMAHRLNLEVVAEGVETPEQLDYLRQCHCDIIQGYFYSPPVSAGEFGGLLHDEHFAAEKSIA